MSALDVVDTVAVAAVLVGALVVLARRATSKAPPPCHPSRTAPSSGPADDVVLGASLARGLDRARRRRR